MREISTTQTVWKYQALDGTIFNNKQDCEKYETNELHTSVSEMFKLKSICSFVGNKKHLGFGDYVEDDTFWKVKPENESELHIVNRVLQYYGNNVFPIDAVGKWIILRRPEGCSEIYGYIAKQLLQNIIDYHKELFPTENEAE